jgi:hypothetical protein
MRISILDSFTRLLPPESRGDSPATGPGSRRGGARRVSARTRRRLVHSLRRLANRQPSSHAARRRFEVLLLDRVAPVRADLLEIAALLEAAPDPDPGCVRSLHRLLTDGCESPLYNPEVHPSELRATLYYVRSGLGALSGSSP